MDGGLLADAAIIASTGPTPVHCAILPVMESCARCYCEKQGAPSCFVGIQSRHTGQDARVQAKLRHFWRGRIDLGISYNCLEARAGIEPACTDLQSATSPLRHRAAPVVLLVKGRLAEWRRLCNRRCKCLWHTRIRRIYCVIVAIQMLLNYGQYDSSRKQRDECRHDRPFGNATKRRTPRVFFCRTPCDDRRTIAHQ